jgi:hypothetical protein
MQKNKIENARPRQVAEALGMSQGHAHLELSNLVEAGFVLRVKRDSQAGGPQRSFFSWNPNAPSTPVRNRNPSVATKANPAALAESNQRAAAAVNYVNRNPGCTTVDVAVATGVKRRAAARYLNRAESHGAVRRDANVQSNTPDRWFPNNVIGNNVGNNGNNVGKNTAGNAENSENISILASRVRATVDSYPGLSTVGVAERVGGKLDVIKQVLDELETSGEIYGKNADGNGARWFPTTAGTWTNAERKAVAKPRLTGPMIIAHIEAHPGCTTNDIRKAFGTTVDVGGMVSYAIGRRIRRDLILAPDGSKRKIARWYPAAAAVPPINNAATVNNAMTVNNDNDNGNNTVNNDTVNNSANPPPSVEANPKVQTVYVGPAVLSDVRRYVGEARVWVGKNPKVADYFFAIVDELLGSA